MPHVMPSTEHFENYVRGLGITNEDKLVIYDTGDSHIWYAIILL
jgi:3-mercaptopyruvate sulfurtransferase SseA